MPITLPAIRNQYLQALTLTGAISANDVGRLNLPKRAIGVPQIAEVKAGAASAILAVYFEGESTLTLHLDLLPKRSLAKAVAPKSLIQPATMLRTLERFRGIEVRASGAAHYRLPTSDLPEMGIIHSTFLKTSEGQLSIHLTAGEITLKGAPITKLRWRLSDNEKSISVSLDSAYIRTVDDDYISEAYRLFESAFRTLVLGGDSGKQN